LTPEIARKIEHYKKGPAEAEIAIEESPIVSADACTLRTEEEGSVHIDDPEKKVGGMIQVSGLRFTYTVDKKFVSRVQAVLVAGKPLSLRQHYRIATNSMLADGGHHYRAFTRGADRREFDPQYDIIERAFGQRERIATK
jgi:2',3'-cyclic-nucleotide 2'-phosphodiesterase (5'-nucleotidase family)